MQGMTTSPRVDRQRKVIGRLSPVRCPLCAVSYDILPRAGGKGIPPRMEEHRRHLGVPDSPDTRLKQRLVGARPAAIARCAYRSRWLTVIVKGERSECDAF